MERITESPIVGYLTPEAQTQRQVQQVLQEPLTNRQHIDALQVRLSGLMREVRQVQGELSQRWQEELKR